MGLFCFSTTDTPEDALNCALVNLGLFEDHSNIDDDTRDKYGNRIPVYLLKLVEQEIKKALELLKNSKDMSINNNPTTHG